MDYIPEIAKRSRKSQKKDSGAIAENSGKRVIRIGKAADNDPVAEKSDDADILTLTRKENTVSRKRLVSKLNHLHFTNNTIQIQFENAYNHRITNFRVRPQICFNKYVVCLWQNDTPPSDILESYRFKQIELITNEQVISVPATIRALNHRGICLALPENSTEHTNRKVTRYACKPLEIKLIQSGIIFSGILMDFSTSAFRVELDNNKETPFHWINARYRVNVIVMSGEGSVYTGECRITKRSDNARRQEIILTPLKQGIQRFAPRVHRSKRIILTPSPDIQFNHPITGDMANLKVLDISGSGLSVEDDGENSVLIPGLIIPSLIINFANSFSFVCQVQVLYRQSFTNKNGRLLSKCGITFLDVDPNDHIKLLSMLHNSENKNIYVCKKVDSDKLWEFFFETGFIYPKKYAFLQGCTEQIKKTYNTLYSQQSSISRHFTWQKKNEILAHLGMLRFYEKSWLIQHLAARSSRHIGAGIQMLNQAVNFTLDSHRLISSNMDYLLCYFRPEMRFPNHFFSGISNKVQNPKVSSLDDFAYIHFRANQQEAILSPPWHLEKPDRNDLLMLQSYYENVSGGLMLNALDLLPDNGMDERKDLACQYQKHGLIRERRMYALKKKNCTKAIIMANISDIALNLSDLTNCISLFILEKDDLHPDILHNALSLMAKHYPRQKFPVLVYPLKYVQEHHMSYNRIYQLWSLSMEYSDECFQYYDSII